MIHPAKYEQYLFAMYRRNGGKIHKLQTVRCRLRDAELEALDIAKELDKEIVLSWQDPETKEWHVFGKYYPDGTRRLKGEAIHERRVPNAYFGHIWEPITTSNKEGGER